jgi:hypothetical protein
VNVAPRCSIMGSVKTVASLASTRLESISAERPCPERWKASCVVNDAYKHPPKLILQSSMGTIRCGTDQSLGRKVAIDWNISGGLGAR